jgi:hypothetical protein
MMSFSEGKSEKMIYPEPINAAALSWVNKYLNLKPELKNRCDIAIDRLSLARRRIHPADQAIDGSICLEALLVGVKSTEITYKISLRAALLLAANLDDRRKIVKDIKNFYSLRSDIVHGTKSQKWPPESKDAQIAASGLKICGQVLQKIVRLNRDFDHEEWAALELSNGKYRIKLKGKA